MLEKLTGCFWCKRHQFSVQEAFLGKILVACTKFVFDKLDCSLTCCNNIFTEILCDKNKLNMAPLDILQPMYGVYPEPIVVKYGPPYSPSSTFMTLFSLVTTPITIVTSFIIGIILYLITHKKVFIIIPLILSFLYLIRYILIEKILGIYL